MFLLSLAWESLQKRDNSALNSFQGRLLCRVETAYHLEVPGVYYRRDNQRVERLALEWTRLFFKSRTSFKRLSIALLVESMKVEKKIVSSWTFSNSLTKSRGSRLSPFTFVFESFLSSWFQACVCHLSHLSVSSPLTWCSCLTKKLDAVRNIDVKSSTFVLNVAKFNLWVRVVDFFVDFNMKLPVNHHYVLCCKYCVAQL